MFIFIANRAKLNENTLKSVMDSLYFVFKWQFSMCLDISNTYSEQDAL